MALLVAEPMAAAPPQERVNFHRSPLQAQSSIDVGALSVTLSKTSFATWTPWYDAFGVRAGQKLYLAPADRVRIW